eukprot:gene5141-7160_t
MGNSNNSVELEQKVGYRVLGVQPNSPASRGGLVSFFDFIVQANGIPLRSLDTTFIELIKASEDKPLPLTIYNCKNHSIREIILVPSRNWPGEGMLGVTIRFDCYHDAEEHMCHVLEVEANSPADLAGLQPHKDYLLGTAEKVFKDTEILNTELLENIDKPVEFYVYNVEADEVRVVVIMPTRDWGGEGILGANVAHGFLHGLPASCCETIGLSSEGSTHRVINSPFGINTQQPLFGSNNGGVDKINNNYFTVDNNTNETTVFPVGVDLGNGLTSQLPQNIYEPHHLVTSFQINNNHNAIQTAKQ